MSLVLDLVEATGISATRIMAIIATAPARYKVYPILKRNGGQRIIAQPARELKLLQRIILEEKLAAFPVHECAMAYEKGKNIYMNALIHKNSNVILKLDFNDFFPSIKTKDWETFLLRTEQTVIDIKDIKLYSKILFWGKDKKSVTPKCLSIGAPTSPMISNILMNEFDVVMSAWATDANLNYSRYADDITLSGESLKEIESLEKKARKFVRNMTSPKLRFNDEKRGIYTRGQRRMVTGLILTPTGTISIGRERKRTISAMLHRAILNKLDFNDKSKLKGFLGFSAANEPEFIGRLREKYGNKAVDSAMKFHAPKRDEIESPDQ